MSCSSQINSIHSMSFSSRINSIVCMSCSCRINSIQCISCSFRINNMQCMSCSSRIRGWSGGAMVLGKLPVPGRPTIWITVGQGPTALTVGAGGGCLDIFTLIYPFSPLPPSLWETARYRLKYCLKGPLNPKTTNQPKLSNQ